MCHISQVGYIFYPFLIIMIGLPIFDILTSNYIEEGHFLGLAIGFIFAIILVVSFNYGKTRGSSIPRSISVFPCDELSHIIYFIFTAFCILYAFVRFFRKA